MPYMFMCIYASWLKCTNERRYNYLSHVYVHTHINTYVHAYVLISTRISVSRAWRTRNYCPGEHPVKCSGSAGRLATTGKAST